MSADKGRARFGVTVTDTCDSKDIGTRAVPR
jgi:hypothetical protein